MFIAIKFKAEKCLRPCERKFLIAVTQGFIRNKLRSVGCQLLKVSVEGEFSKDWQNKASKVWKFKPRLLFTRPERIASAVSG